MQHSFVESLFLKKASSCLIGLIEWCSTDLFVSVKINDGLLVSILGRLASLFDAVNCDDNSHYQKDTADDNSSNRTWFQAIRYRMNFDDQTLSSEGRVSVDAEFDFCFSIVEAGVVCSEPRQAQDDSTEGLCTRTRQENSRFGTKGESQISAVPKWRDGVHLVVQVERYTGHLGDEHGASGVRTDLTTKAIARKSIDRVQHRGKCLPLSLRQSNIDGS